MELDLVRADLRRLDCPLIVELSDHLLRVGPRARDVDPLAAAFGPLEAVDSSDL